MRIKQQCSTLWMMDVGDSGSMTQRTPYAAALGPQESQDALLPPTPVPTAPTYQTYKTLLSAYFLVLLFSCFIVKHK